MGCRLYLQSTAIVVQSDLISIYRTNPERCPIRMKRISLVSSQMIYRFQQIHTIHIVNSIISQYACQYMYTIGTNRFLKYYYFIRMIIFVVIDYTTKAK